jgi:undecaprenyl diphosphate synthase
MSWSEHGEATPLHVAIIMDGNGRWAQARGLPRIAGHRRGMDSVRTVVEAAVDLGISHLTLFGFSSENWRRPEAEVNELMRLLDFYLRSEVAELHRQQVKIRVIGQLERLPRETTLLIETAERLTAGNTRLGLTVALSYGGRDEIVSVTRSLMTKAKNGDLDPEALDEALFDRHLFTADLPDPDLVIRTSGEKRISNFLLWQSAYSELVFVDTAWPDFSRQDLEGALCEYRGRERRFGATAGSSV